MNDDFKLVFQVQPQASIPISNIGAIKNVNLSFIENLTKLSEGKDSFPQFAAMIS